MYQEADTSDTRSVRLPAGFPCRLGFLLAKTHAGMRAIIDAELAPHGLTIVQFSLLEILAANPGKSSAELSRAFCVSPQSMAPLVSRLESEGYLERRRHPVHARVIECWITDEGAALLERARSVVANTESELILAELSGEELKVLEELLYRVLGRVRARTGGSANVDLGPLKAFAPGSQEGSGPD